MTCLPLPDDILASQRHGGVGQNGQRRRPTFYRSQHEQHRGVRGRHGGPHQQLPLGQRGRYRANVWNYPGFNASRGPVTLTSGAENPVALIVDALRDCSRRGETVLDPFWRLRHDDDGRGTYRPLGRLIEIDPIYCDVIVRR